MPKRSFEIFSAATSSKDPFIVQDSGKSPRKRRKTTCVRENAVDQSERSETRRIKPRKSHNKTTAKEAPRPDYRTLQNEVETLRNRNDYLLKENAELQRRCLVLEKEEEERRKNTFGGGRTGRKDFGSKECPVCFTKLRKWPGFSAAIPCGHVICSTCASKLKKRRSNCSCCNGRIAKYERLFFN